MWAKRVVAHFLETPRPFLDCASYLLTFQPTSLAAHHNCYYALLQEVQSKCNVGCVAGMWCVAVVPSSLHTHGATSQPRPAEQVITSLLILGCLWVNGVDAAVHPEGVRRRKWWRWSGVAVHQTRTPPLCTRSTLQKGGQRSGREGQPPAGRVCGASGRVHRERVLWGREVQQRGLWMGRRRLLPRDLCQRRLQVREVE